MAFDTLDSKRRNRGAVYRETDGSYTTSNLFPEAQNNTKGLRA